MNSPPKQAMSRAKFATGLALSLIIALTFYTWLLYGVFGVPLTWVLIIMGQVAVAATLIGLFGYRRWASKHRDQADTVESSSRVNPIAVLIFSLGIALPTWGAAYLMWLGLGFPALLVGCIAAGIAIYGFRQGWIRQPDVQTNEKGTRNAPQEFRLLRGFLLLIAVVCVASLVIILAVQGDFVFAAVLFAIFLAGLPAVIRRAVAELNSRNNGSSA